MRKFLKIIIVAKVIVLVLFLAEASFCQVREKNEVEKRIILEITETNYGLFNPKEKLYFRLYKDGIIEYDNLIRVENQQPEFKWINEQKQISKELLQTFEQLIIAKDIRYAKKRYGKLVFGVDDFSITVVKVNLGNIRRKIEFSGFFLSKSHKQAHLHYPVSILNLIKHISILRPKQDLWH